MRGSVYGKACFFVPKGRPQCFHSISMQCGLLATGWSATSGVRTSEPLPLIAGAMKEHVCLTLKSPLIFGRRLEERRVGKEWVSTFRSRRSPYHENKNKLKKKI